MSNSVKESVGLSLVLGGHPTEHAVNIGDKCWPDVLSVSIDTAGTEGTTVTFRCLLPDPFILDRQVKPTYIGPGGEEEYIQEEEPVHMYLRLDDRLVVCRINGEVLNVLEARVSATAEEPTFVDLEYVDTSVDPPKKYLWYGQVMPKASQEAI